MKSKLENFSKKGQALVEMALIAPIVLLILMGIIDVGIIFNNYSIISNATREAARFGVVGYSNEEMNTVIDNATSNLSGIMEVDITPTELERVRGVELIVEIDYTIEPVTPLISAILPDPFIISSKTAMRVE